MKAAIAAGVLDLSVTNSGKKISDDMLPGLFLPFERREDSPNREGLGLGHFIASEIAKGHGSTLEVSSDDDQTVFTFKMPCHSLLLNLLIDRIG